MNPSKYSTILVSFVFFVKHLWDYLITGEVLLFTVLTFFLPRKARKENEREFRKGKHDRNLI